MDWTIVLALLATAFQVGAYSIYNWQVYRGTSKPNAASWGIWVLLAVLNALTYLGTSGDKIVTMPFTIGAFACALTFIHALKTKKFSPLDILEKIAFGVGLSVVVVWWIWGNAAYANMVVLAANVIAFYLIMRELYRNPEKETSLSWIFWSIASAVMVINLILRWNGQLMTVPIPIFFLIVNVMVACLCTEKRKNHVALAKWEKEGSL